MRKRSAVTLAVATYALMAPGAAFGDDQSGGEIGSHFVGVSIEWTLTDRYMGENSRVAFANLLRNLGSGVLRIGGSSQDQVPFDTAAADSDRFVTSHDLTRIRETLQLADSDQGDTPEWVTVLGTAMAMVS